MKDLPKPIQTVLANRLERLVSGALRSTIHEHGPITPNWVGSATKRVCGQIRGALKQEMRESMIDEERSEPEELRGFFFTNMYLSSIQKGIQSAHAVHDTFVKYASDLADETFFNAQDARKMLWEWARSHRTMIVLDAGYHEEIESLADFFDTEENPYPWEIVNEAEEALNEAATCIMIVLPESIYKTAEKVRKGKYKPDKDIEDDTVEKRLEREYGLWKGQLIKQLNQYRLAH